MLKYLIAAALSLSAIGFALAHNAPKAADCCAPGAPCCTPGADCCK